MIKIKTLSKDNFTSKAIKYILYSIINILAYIPMLCAFKYNQTLVHPITTRGASNISPVSHPQLTMPPWAGPRGSLALLHLDRLCEWLLTLDWVSLSRKSNPSFFSKRGRYDTECACPVLDLILIYRVLHVKDMSFDKQGASGVSDQQHTTSFYKTTLFCDHSGVLLSRAPQLQNNKYTSLVQGTEYHKW